MKISEEELIRFRDGELKKLKLDFDKIVPVINANFIGLCRIMEVINEPTRVKTPLGYVIFEKMPMFAYKDAEEKKE